MNPLTIVALCVALAAANAGVVAPAHGLLANAAAVAAHDSPIVAARLALPALAAPAVVAHHGLAHPGLAHHGFAHAGLAHPGVLAHHGVVAARAGLIASPVKADGYPLLAPGSGIEGQYLHDLSGHGLDGQYVHDFTETLYDNGQYHGEIYP